MMNPEQMWNNRYAEEGYAYGKEPNSFLKESLSKLPAKGAILFVAEGEGRNAVYAAKQGWDVHAFDISTEGKRKALALANETKVEINYSIGPLKDQSYVAESFDCVVLIYAHFPEAIRSEIHEELITFLKPGGQLIVEAFSKSHVENQKKNPSAGGPKAIGMLYDVGLIQRDFYSLRPILIENRVINLSEGKYHQGPASVIRFIGKKH